MRQSLPADILMIVGFLHKRLGGGFGFVLDWRPSGLEVLAHLIFDGAISVFFLDINHAT